MAAAQLWQYAFALLPGQDAAQRSIEQHAAGHLSGARLLLWMAPVVRLRLEGGEHRAALQAGQAFNLLVQEAGPLRLRATAYTAGDVRLLMQAADAVLRLLPLQLDYAAEQQRQGAPADRWEVFVDAAGGCLEMGESCGATAYAFREAFGVFPGDAAHAAVAVQQLAATTQQLAATGCRLVHSAAGGELARHHALLPRLGSLPQLLSLCHMATQCFGVFVRNSLALEQNDDGAAWQAASR